MAATPNKLSQFWQDLKRRNVVRVITVYTGAAFVILSLVDMIREPFELPNWSFKLVVVILSIGLIIAVILSWIYDINPEGGIVKTDSADKIMSKEPPKSSKGWKVASYISFVVIVGLIVLNIIPRTGKKELLEKSIAVLPFENDSPEETEMFFLNGTMESILDNLCMIEDLRVVSRTSTEQYRNNLKPIPTIAKEMDVSYVLEGSGLKHGDNIRLTIQLIDGVHDQHIWSQTYNRKTSEIFELQSEIAQLVAKDIEAVITPEEKKLIEKAPTYNLMANEFYQRGREEYIKFLLDVRDRDALKSAQEYYLKALEYDSTFAKACAGVAMTFYSKLAVYGRMAPIYSDGYLEDHAFDTVLFWVNKALRIEKQLPEAYYIRGNYYIETGNREKAEQDYQTAFQLNPNYWEAYYGLGYMYFSIDFIRVFKYFQKAASLVRGPELSYIFNVIIQTYALSGNLEHAESLIADYVNLTQDSLLYYRANDMAEVIKRNPENSHNWLTKAYAYDSTIPSVLSNLAESYVDMGKVEEGLKYYEQSEDINHKLNRIDYNRLHRIGYAYWLAGYKEEADYYFDRQEEICKSLIRLNRPWAQFGLAQFDLALIYAFRGEKSEAMEELSTLHQRSDLSYFIMWYIQSDPMLDSIRDDPEFQQIANDLAIRLQDGTADVRQWLEENDML